MFRKEAAAVHFLMTALTSEFRAATMLAVSDNKFP